MIVYDVKLYDPKTDTVTVVFTVAERRRDPNRPRGRTTIQNLAKSLLGNEFWSKNWHNISITEWHVYSRDVGRDGKSNSNEKCFFIIER